ncbi:MAG: glycosyltransferase family 4 protein, partial [Thermoplasmata archaeon]|nr:glycosyltransferase family 4 protein [Thermoplasmata archaeon]
PRGGVVHALSLAEAISAMGEEVMLFALKRRDIDTSRVDFYRPTDVPYTLFEFDWHEDVRERLRSMADAFIENLPRDFDIYHAQDCVCDTALQMLVSEEAIVPPTVRTVHHVERFSDPYLAKCEIMAVKADTVKTTVSSYWRKELHEKFGIDSTVIHNGIDLTRFPFRDGHREPFILFVGGMEARKGLEFAIQTLEILARRGRDLKLIAIAKPGFKGTETRQWFDHLIDRCGLNSKVEIREMVSDSELRELYSRASVFLLPSRMEGWGLSIMEAMASGCPVIATPVGGVTEFVSDGETGILIDLGDLHGFAGAIERLLDDEKLRDKLTHSARESLWKYTWKSAAEKTIELYMKIIVERKQATA